METDVKYGRNIILPFLKAHGDKKISKELISLNSKGKKKHYKEE